MQNTVQQIKEDGNYYPQDFYDETDDDDDNEPLERAGVGTHPDHNDDDNQPPERAGVGTHLDDDKPPESAGVAPQDDGNDTVECQEELDCEMTKQYGPRTEHYNMQ